MKLKNKNVLKKQILEEQQILIKTFSPKEIAKINQLISDLHKIRKVEPPSVRYFWQKKKAIKEQIEMIAEQEFYFVFDFVIENGWSSDRDKITALWKYLELEFN